MIIDSSKLSHGIDSGEPVPEGAAAHTVIDGNSEHGKSTITIQCPFCGSESVAYLWSLAGSGKRCECGALHDYFGYTTPKKG